MTHNFTIAGSDPSEAEIIIARELHSNASTHLKNHLDYQVYIPLCTHKTPCLYSANEYISDNGDFETDRTCSPCPRLCAGQTIAQPSECGEPSGSWPGYDGVGLGVATHHECLRPAGDNSEVCCRVDYDRTVYQWNLGGICEVSNDPSESHAVCTNTQIETPFLSTTTTTTVTVVTGTITTTTTTYLPCGRGEFYDTGAGACANCPLGQFQRLSTSFATSCQPKTPCTHDEIELIDFNDTHSRMTDSVCGSLHGCSHGQYRANFTGDRGSLDESDDPKADIHQVGRWKVSCTDMQQLLDEWEASGEYNGAGDIPIDGDRFDCDSQYELTISYVGGVWSIDTPVGHHLGHEQLSAVAALQKVRVCRPWRSCLATDNEFILVEGSETHDRVCSPCPVIHSECWNDDEETYDTTLFPYGRSLNETSIIRKALFGPDGNTAHPCNSQSTYNDYGYSDNVPAGGLPECTRVSADNQHYCCRVSYDRTQTYFDNTGDLEWDSTGEACTAEQTCTKPGWRYELVDFPTTTTTTVTMTTETSTTKTTIYGGWINDPSVVDGSKHLEAQIVGWGALGIASSVLIWAVLKRTKTDFKVEDNEVPPRYTANSSDGARNRLL
jgi:hypothetical protein